MKKPVRMMLVEGTAYQSVAVDADGRFVPLVELLDAINEAQRAEEKTLKDDIPLRCEVVNGAIQVVVGTKVLAHATSINPEFYDDGSDRGLYEVTDHALFAEGVVHWINKEDEAGNTRLTRMLDAAITEAIEQGEEGVIERTDGPESPHG